MNLENIQKTLESFNINNDLGYAVSIVKNGENIFTKVHGYADRENSLLVHSTTNFRLASVSKQFIAVGILILFQNKKISLEDTLQKFFPDFPPYGENINIYQLLTHSSGLKDYEDLIPQEQKAQIHDEDVLTLLMNQSSGLFPSGSKYSYNNGGYCLLRLIIEKIAGQDIGEFLKENIFIPLKMNNTMVNYEGKTLIPYRAYGYTYSSNGQATKTDQDITSATIGDGGIYSSLNDLEKWDQVLCTDIILSPEMRNLMLTKHILTDEGNDIYYGFGLFIKDYNDKKVAYHGGSSVGFRSGIYYFIEEQITSIFLSNSTGSDGSLVAETIAKREVVNL